LLAKLEDLNDARVGCGGQVGVLGAEAARAGKVP
jgi:hypothetical protein